MKCLLLIGCISFLISFSCIFLDRLAMLLYDIYYEMRLTPPAPDGSKRGDRVKAKTKKNLTRLLIMGVPVVVLFVGLKSGDLPKSVMALRDATAYMAEKM